MNEKTYARQFREGQPRPTMEMDREEAGAEAVRRARHYAREQGHRQVTAADLRDIYRDDLDLRARALGFDGPGREPSQRERAGRHYAQEVRKYMALGHSREGAIKRTRDEERRGGLSRVRAGLPANSPWAAAGEGRRQDEARCFSKLVGGSPFTLTERAYAAGDEATLPEAGNLARLNDAERKLRDLSAEDMVNLLITAPERGRLHEWLPFLRAWARLTSGPYPAGQAPKGPQVDASNALQERVWQRARQERLRRRGFMD